MNKKIDPVIVGVIIVVAILITFGIAGFFTNNIVVQKDPTYNKDNSGFDNSEKNNEDNEKEDEVQDDYNTNNEEDIEDKQETNNDNNYNNDTNDTNREFMMKCSINTERGLEENYFYFNYNPTYNDNYITKYVIKLTIKDGLDINDYYVSEQIMNSGRYRMSLDNRTIISEIDPTWAFWNSKDFKYKDMAYRYINKEFVENGYSCE